MARWRRPLVLLIFITLVFVFVSVLTWVPQEKLEKLGLRSRPQALPKSPSRREDELLRYFVNYPLDGPRHASQVGELGQRLQYLNDRFSALELPTLSPSLDEVLVSMFPFLQTPVDSNNDDNKIKNKTNKNNNDDDDDDDNPFASLRASFVPGSRGIVIPTGSSGIRFTSHLIVTIREVLLSTLPIQIAYAGDGDLPPYQREILRSIGEDVEFLDLLNVFTDKTLDLARAGWSTKPFALLASKYEQVILLDADAVFLQPPEVLFSQADYQSTGALFFHDRLLWQHAFQERHVWWKEQMAYQTPSDTLMKSLVWNEDYAEEADSGVIVMDKSRLPVLLGLLHVCWQNSLLAREEITKSLTYGDKESWWFGLELSGAPYSFEKHYGSIIGWHEVDSKTQEDKVCSFTIAHVDEDDKLLWLNGSLLKNKAIDTALYEVPSHWMMDATWEKGARKQDMSCMVGGKAMRLQLQQINILVDSIKAAMRVDAAHATVFGLG